MARIIDFWEVNTDSPQSSPRTLMKSYSYICAQEPERIIDYYKLETYEGKTIHLMVKDLSYISWFPVYKD